MAAPRPALLNKPGERLRELTPVPKVDVGQMVFDVLAGKGIEDDLSA